MHKTTLLTIVVLLMVAATLIICRSTPRYQGETHLLPIDQFPRQIGDWQAGPNIATNPEVQARIPTARIVERAYTNRGGNPIDLLLLTATTDEDFHSPTACLPGQGWTLSDQKEVQVAGHRINSMTAEQNGEALTVLYYWVKMSSKTGPAPGLPQALLYRTRQLVSHESLSLFVRIIVPQGSQSRADMLRFTALTWDAMQPLLGGKGEIVLAK